MAKASFGPGSVMFHAFLSGTKDPDTQRPYFEGDFGDFTGWAINYAVQDAYGLRVGTITSGKGKYQQMKRAAPIGPPGSTIDPNIGGITPIV